MASTGGTVAELLEVPGLCAGETLRVGEGEKGPIVAGFARLRGYLRADRTPVNERWLWLRQDPNMKIKDALSQALESCPMQGLMRVSLARWPIERCFQENQGELGLDHYEHRSWTAWHRHLRLRLKESPVIDPATSPQAVGLEFSVSRRF